MDGFLLDLPVPPSANRLHLPFRVKSGKRPRTPQYRAWIKAAGGEILLQRPRPITGKFRLLLTCGVIRGDPDNLLKPTLDLLVAHRLVPDDRAAYSVNPAAFVLPEHPKDRVTVSVEVV